MGRPSKYSAALAKAICTRLAGGESLRKICKSEGMPSITTVLSWATGHTVEANEADFPKQYAIARATRSELYADEIVDLADDKDVDPQRSRLQVDARKWVASKLLPKTYGDKVSHEHSGPDGLPIAFQRVELVIVDDAPTDSSD
jgi:hypothetical protein